MKCTRKARYKDFQELIVIWILNNKNTKIPKYILLMDQHIRFLITKIAHQV